MKIFWFFIMLLFCTQLAFPVARGPNKNTNDSNSFINDNANHVSRRVVGSLINPDTDSPALISPGGTLNVGTLIRLVGGNFISGRPLLSHIWTETFTGSGSTSTTDGELILSTGTIANSSVSVESFQDARFITATFNLARMAIGIPNNTNINVIREWGAYNSDLQTDGVAFRGVSGNASVIRYKNGSIAEEVQEVDFNGNTSIVRDDNVHIYEIFYSAGVILFQQDGNLIHTMQALDSAAFGTPHLKVGHRLENINGNTTVNTMVTRGSSISRIGSSESAPRSFIIETTGTFLVKNTPGRLHSVIVTDKGAGVATIDVFNNVVALAPKLVSSIDSSNVQGNLPFNVEFDDALTIVVGGASVSLTIIYD